VVQSWLDNDADRFADYYTEDATLISDTYMRDQDHIRSFMKSERGFGGVYKDSVLEVHPQNVRFVRDDVAIVTTQGSITFPSLPAEEAKKGFFATIVIVKGETGQSADDPESPRIALVHSSRSGRPGGTSSCRSGGARLSRSYATP